MRFFVWVFRAFVFFALFAFALNNQQDAVMRLFFGQEWRAPMIFIVLVAFGGGCAFGVVAMVPSWWKHRREAQRLQPTETAATPMQIQPAMPAEHPPRDGL